MLNSKTESIVLPVECITEQEVQKLSRKIGLSTYYRKLVTAFKYNLKVDKIYWTHLQLHNSDENYICSSYQEFEEAIKLHQLNKLLGVNYESI